MATATATATAPCCYAQPAVHLRRAGISMTQSLSNRGRALRTPPPRSLEIAYAARADRYNAKTNPHGFIDLSVAENGLMLHTLHTKICAVACPPVEWLVYDDAYGSFSFRVSVAEFLARYFFPQGERCRAPHAEDVISTCGAGTAVDLLSSVLCDEGDVVLVPGPGYGGFARDLVKRAKVDIVVVGTEPSLEISVQALEQAWVVANESGSRVSMLVVTSPNNPTGLVLCRDDIRDIVTWGRSRAVHIVFDEAYALSVYANSAKFCSVAHVLDGHLGEDVHIVWTASKDFAWSGARLGVIYSQNRAVLEAIRPALSYLTGTSRQTQWTMMNILNDRQWVAEFVAENRSRLLEASTSIRSVLEKHNVPYFAAEAGLFLWIDLRKWMGGNTVQDEVQLWQRMASYKVLLTPSNEQFGQRRGFFRLCFASVDKQALQVALHRLFANVLS